MRAPAPDGRPPPARRPGRAADARGGPRGCAAGGERPSRRRRARAPSTIARARASLPGSARLRRRGRERLVLAVARDGRRAAPSPSRLPLACRARARPSSNPRTLLSQPRRRAASRLRTAWPPAGRATRARWMRFRATAALSTRRRRHLPQHRDRHRSASVPAPPPRARAGSTRGASRDVAAVARATAWTRPSWPSEDVAMCRPCPHARRDPRRASPRRCRPQRFTRFNRWASHPFGASSEPLRRHLARALSLKDGSGPLPAARQPLEMLPEQTADPPAPGRHASAGSQDHWQLQRSSCRHGAQKRAPNERAHELAGGKRRRRGSPPRSRAPQEAFLLGRAPGRASRRTPEASPGDAHRARPATKAKSARKGSAPTALRRASARTARALRAQAARGTSCRAALRRAAFPLTASPRRRRRRARCAIRRRPRRPHHRIPRRPPAADGRGTTSSRLSARAVFGGSARPLIAITARDPRARTRAPSLSRAAQPRHHLARPAPY